MALGGGLTICQDTGSVGVLKKPQTNIISRSFGINTMHVFRGCDIQQDDSEDGCLP